MLKNITLYFLALILPACSFEKENDPSNVLVKVGDKIITVEEFIQRAEYTVRPPYCRGDNYIHKKIVLNSLIGEKLLALEAGEDNELAANKDFTAYVEGRREQTMREVHLRELAYSKVELDSSAVRKQFELAGRNYKTSFFSVSINEFNRAAVNNYKNLQFEEISRRLSDTVGIQQKEIIWHHSKHPVVHSLLYESSPAVDQVIGPVLLDSDHYLFLKVDGWEDTRPVNAEERGDRIKQVEQKMMIDKAVPVYTDYVSNLMRGKRMQFHKDTFIKLSGIVEEAYESSPGNDNFSLNSLIWKNTENEDYISNLPETIEAISDWIFFEIDGETWNVGKFRDYLKRHPLVFRKEGAEERSFEENFRLAIADAVRDFYITRDAYDQGYDEFDEVKRSEDMWRSNLLSVYQKNKYLAEVITDSLDQYQVISNYMTPYVDSLQQKYSNTIFINMELFEKIKLSRIDMIALQPGQPFLSVVPAFPLVTDDDRLNYGSLLK